MPNEKETPKPKHWMDEVVKTGLESIQRYGGNPDLLLKEHPELDFRNPPDEALTRPSGVSVLRRLRDIRLERSRLIHQVDGGTPEAIQLNLWEEPALERVIHQAD
jgi:hypothetical protein